MATTREEEEEDDDDVITLQSCRLLTHSTCCFSQNGSGFRAQTAARWLASVICTCSVEALSRRQQPWRASISTTTLLLDDDPLLSSLSSPKKKTKKKKKLNKSFPKHPKARIFFFFFSRKL